MKVTIYTTRAGKRAVHFVAELQESSGLFADLDFVIGICESMKWSIQSDDIQPEQWFTMADNRRWVSEDSAFDAASVVTGTPGSRLKLFVDGLGEVFCDLEYPTVGK